jgi:hypothetical protein
MNNDELKTTMRQLGYHLISVDKKPPGGKKILAVLKQLPDAGELRLVEGFPVVLADCVHRGIKVDLDNLLVEEEPNIQKKTNLERLLLISIELLKEEGLELSDEMIKTAESLRGKYGNLQELKSIDMGENRSVSITRLRNAVKRYSLDLKKSESVKEKARRKQLSSFQLNLHLSILFTPRQKELIFKKLNQAPLTKTEREYFSRVIKKKLVVLTNNELRKIARSLMKK